MPTLPALVIPALIAVCVGATSTAAFADTWRAKTMLDPASPAACQQADVSRLFFAFADAGPDLSVTAGETHTFLVPVSADGSVNKTITVPVGNRTFTVDLTGNAKGRDLQVVNREYACRFKLLPMP